MPKNKKVVYKNLPNWANAKNLAEVKDFLPSPEELILQPKMRKVTLTLSEESIDFFKAKAEKLNTSYQRMIRVLLQEYTQITRYR